MKICELDIAAYRGTVLQVRYDTSYIYEAVAEQRTECFGVMFQRTALPSFMRCGFDDVWGSEWLDEAELFAALEDEETVGLLEICMERWTQRLRISNFYVNPASRGKGCATQLLQYVKELAKLRHIRCIVLETQSCNDPAIQCYLRNGFVFSGCDLSFKSNTDIHMKNVRIEMSCYI